MATERGQGKIIAPRVGASGGMPQNGAGAAATRRKTGRAPNRL
jgi:hypothetical protein